MNRSAWCRRNAPVLLLLVCNLAVSVSSVRAQVSGPLNAASTTQLPGVTGGSGSYSPGFSANGRFLVFTSRANNLVTNDSNAIWLDVFVRDLLTDTTILVSVSRTGTGGGDGNSFNPTISSNGQFIAFETAASNLVMNDTNGVNDVYVRDMVAQTTTLASVNTNGVAGDGVSKFPVITSDGHQVAFESTSDDLVFADTNSLKDIFVRDLAASSTLMASKGVQTATNGFESPSISADGHWIAFASVSGLSFSNPDRKSDVFVRDLTADTTIWASSNLNDLATTVRSFNPALSADGKFVAFKSTLRTTVATATNLYQYDLQAFVETLVSSNVVEEGFPEMTPDGRFVAYESHTNVLIWDRQTGSNTLVSVDVAGINAASGTSYRPVLTPDGSKIAFLTDATNVTANGGNGQPQLYVRDLVAATTSLVSVNLDDQPLSSLSGVIPVITADGNQVAFWSTDEGIVADDQNRDADVFVRDLTSDTTTLISARLPSLPTLTGGGIVTLSENFISADGRLLLIGSTGGRLVEGDQTSLAHVVVCDLATRTNRPVDTFDNPDGLPVAAINLPFATNFTARAPAISANGHYAAYVGRITTANPSLDQIYVRDLQTYTNQLASRTWNSSAAGSAKSAAPSLSADGRFVAFQSEASNLVSRDSNGQPDVFVRDLLTGNNFMMSTNRFGTGGGDSASTNPLISRDGRWVVFQSKSTNLVTNSVTGSTNSFVCA
ncbi:MAG: hypothetical protein V9H26_24960 [Verrucomicrobiota bacterium]